MNVIDRFINYVKYDTQSDDESINVPSTEKQIVFAEKIVQELKKIGIKDAEVDQNGYVMATIPSNIENKVPVVGFIAHLDTSPDMSGNGVNPQIVKDYDGKDIILNKEENIILSTKQFPELKKYIGKTLITTDGTTLLGADDKAGIAEIITAAEYLLNHPEVPHGTIKIGFTPDEETGHGADKFNVEKFGADIAYTIDGGSIGEIEYENFNAAAANIIVKGKNIHPGYAYNKMINSIYIANEFISMLPQNEVPEKTFGYEGFFHLISVVGGVEETKLKYIIRDFDLKKFSIRKEKMIEITEKLNKKYGEGTISIEIIDQYFNMKEKIEQVKYVVDIAIEAMKQCDITPIVTPIRGGTDGARLSFMDLPTPNIFTGGENFHGRYEYIPTFSLEKAVELIVKIVQLYS